MNILHCKTDVLNKDFGLFKEIFLKPLLNDEKTEIYD